MDGPVFLDFFAGFGGSSSGLVEAGFELSTAYNHWETAIAVHAANHRQTVTGLRIGSIFTGYGGLTLATEQVLGGTTAWVSDIEQRDKKGALIGNAPLILAHRFPGVPNLGDITAVDWSQVEPVDIIEGGSPCQDVSAAGARAGMTEGTRSNLWVAMREAIAQLKPAIVVWENVYGALSARADSRVESEPGLLGGVPGGPALRAAGRVCGDLASLGFDAEWAVVRASDVGAPHQRARIFIVAAHPERISRHEWWLAAARETGSGGPLNTTARCDRASVRLLPTPAASQYGSNRSLSPGAAVRPSLAAIDKLLPTPNAAKAANDLTLTKSGDGRDSPNKLGWAVALLPTPRVTRGGSGTETVDLLLTPRATDGAKGAPNQRGSSGDLTLSSAVAPLTTPSAADSQGGHERRGGSRSGELLLKGLAKQDRFGDYAPAIARWERVNGPAPDPTEGRRLSARFVEWLMGLSAGWVVDVPGLTRNQQLHALGNGVVPQQAAFAIRMLLTRLALQEAS